MKKKWKATTVFGGLLLLSLALSLVYSLVRMLLAPDVIPEGEPLQKVKADYLLMLVECLLGLLVMMLPTLIKRRWRFVVPSTAVMLYYVFLYCAIYLGEVRNFYYVIPHW
ncbi:MAG: hypothetical protein IJF73_02700, partial [Clostridia bacterium]|nr:hypothetical protein [Clostridia bacterium]